jgi:hypothetical protein
MATTIELLIRQLVFHKVSVLGDKMYPVAGKTNLRGKLITIMLFRR